jgi:hypothetical protein
MLRLKRNGVSSVYISLLNVDSDAIQHPAKPLIAPNSHNIFHDQALVQLASAHESLKYGDSQAATSDVYDLGIRLFGREKFDRAIRHSRLNGSTA